MTNTLPYPTVVKPGAGASSGVDSFLGQYSPQQSYAPPQTPNDRANYAQSQGYTYKNGLWSKDGYQGFSLDDPRFNGPTQAKPSFVDQYGAGIAYDATRQQAAADQEFNQGQANIGNFTNQLAGAPGAIRAAGQSGISMLETAKGAPDLKTFDSQASSLLGKLDQGISTANQSAKSGVAAATAAVNDYEKDQTGAIADQIVGNAANNRAALQRLKSGRDENGNPMTAAQQAEAYRSISTAHNQQSASLAAQMFTDMQKTVASLKTNLASVQLSAANIQQQGATGRANIAGNLASTRLQTTLQDKQINADLTKTQANLGAMAESEAFTAELNGSVALANMIRNNPHGLVSVSSAIASMAAAASMPGAGNASAFSFNGTGNSIDAFGPQNSFAGAQVPKGQPQGFGHVPYTQMSTGNDGRVF